MLDLSVVSANHVRHYCVALAGDAGWVLTIVEDKEICWRETHADWHRVERSVAKMWREVSDLLERGWRIQPVNP
jgi:hypothetical protein